MDKTDTIQAIINRSRKKMIGDIFAIFFFYALIFTSSFFGCLAAGSLVLWIM